MTAYVPGMEIFGATFFKIFKRTAFRTFFPCFDSILTQNHFAPEKGCSIQRRRRSISPMGDNKAIVEPNTIFDKGNDVAFREVDGEVLIVPIRMNASDITGVYRLNRTASFMWKLFDGRRNLKSVIDEVVQNFDVSADVAEADLQELARDLLSFDALVEVSRE